MFSIAHANIKDWAKNYDGELFDGILCDPPYELGFMGKSWDSSGIAFDTDMWADLFKLVKPGGHLLAFSGSRTYHRMAVAIEDAGFEIRDMIEWVYGSGFPKSLNIGKAVDKLQGNEREIMGKYVAPDGKERGGVANNPMDIANYQKGDRSEHKITKGTSEWEGWGTALKPAHEPICLARKPLEKGMTVANNVLKHGTGGLNIDGTRVGTEQVETGRGGRNAPQFSGTYNNGEIYEGKNANNGTITGRFPANLIHDGSDEVEAVFPQTGGGKLTIGGTPRKTDGFIATGSPDRSEALMNYGDKGSASRFFYCAKAGKSERNAGLEGFELKEPPASARSKPADGRQNALGEPRQNHHPTVKPLSLTKYLATLIKPPTGGRLLVPFSGSGSEMIGALQAGWEYVEGVELTEEYIPIAEARIAYWIKQPVQETLDV